MCTDPGSTFYAQATKHSNNTAELTGLLQTIIYLEQEVTDEALERDAVICSDSKYAIGCT